MGLLKILERRRDEKIQEQLRETAGFVATEIVESVVNREYGSLGPIAIGSKPKGIGAEDYTEQINLRVMNCLGRTTIGEVIAYDPEATREANLIEVEPSPPNNPGFVYEAPELHMVYKKT